MIHIYFAMMKTDTRSNNLAGAVDGVGEVVTSSGALDASLTPEGRDNQHFDGHSELEQTDRGERIVERIDEPGANGLGVVTSDVPVAGPVSSTVGVPVSVAVSTGAAGATISVKVQPPASSLIAQAASSGPSGVDIYASTQPMLDLQRQTLVLHTENGEAGVAGVSNDVIAAPLTTPTGVAKRKRRQYASEEERRTARILKNRRTAEESRQRRLKKMKDLEEYAKGAAEREQALREEINNLRATVSAQAALIENMRTMAADIEQRNLDMKRMKLRK